MHPLATSTAAAALATLLALGARAEPLTVYIGYTSLGIVNTTDEQKECLETTPPVRTETRTATDTDERTPGACRTRACTESRDIADCPDGTDDIVGAWIQNACSAWTDIECEAPPIECPMPESDARNHDCPGQTELRQLRNRQPVIEGDTCVLGEWTEWSPPCSSTDVCPTRDTDTRACAGDPNAEQTRARTSSEVNGTCTWGAWAQWTPACPPVPCPEPETEARACATDASIEQARERTSSAVNSACTWGAWSGWTPACPPIPCPEPETEARACATDASIEQARERTSSAVNSACTWGAWSGWTPACPPIPCPEPETEARACASNASIEQTRERTSSLVNNACAWDAWTDWAPDCQGCANPQYRWQTTYNTWVEIVHATQRLTAIGYTPKRIPNELAFSRGFTREDTRPYLGNGQWGELRTRYDIASEVHEGTVLFELFGRPVYKSIWVTSDRFALDPDKIILNYGFSGGFWGPVFRSCDCPANGTETYHLADGIDAETGVPDGPWELTYPTLACS